MSACSSSPTKPLTSDLLGLKNKTVRIGPIKSLCVKAFHFKISCTVVVMFPVHYQVQVLRLVMCSVRNDAVRVSVHMRIAAAIRFVALGLAGVAIIDGRCQETGVDAFVHPSALL